MKSGLFGERRSKSLGRHALDQLLRRMRQLVGGDVQGLHVHQHAIKLVEYVDKAYDLSIRARQMLKQMMDGDWPINQLSGVERATTQAVTWTAWVDDANPVLSTITAIQKLVAEGHGEKEDEDTLIDVHPFIGQVKNASNKFQDILHAFEQLEPEVLDNEISRNSFLSDISHRYEEAAGCLL